MLQTLKIRNIAVIDQAEIPFREGLNVLSGETGAGKSIVLEAISLVLGGRATADLIRTGCDEAVVEGLFDVTSIGWIRARMDALGFDSTSGELLIKRTVARSGKHRIHVNGSLATLSILQELCDGLIDLCGQHEHQSLTRAHTQLELLDRYGSLGAQVHAFGERFGQMRALEAEHTHLSQLEAERSKRADFLRFQIEELREAELTSGEDESLAREKQLLQSAESRTGSAEAVRAALEDEESGALNPLRGSLNRLRALVQLDPALQPTLEGLERGLAELEEVTISLNRYLGAAELDPDRLATVQERLSLLADLRRKYGASVDEMIVTLSGLENQLGELEGAEAKLATLATEIERARAEILKLGKKLSQARKKAAALLGDSVSAELKDLKMDEAVFSVELTEKELLADWTAAGGDAIQFLIRTNRGDTAKSLGKVASGGELSRLMLAIRRVIADKGGIGVYLFDEIDAGIGGQTAYQVGKKLKSVAAYNQVICITHLPQVASFADHHLVVRKSSVGKRTVTEVNELASLKERKEELARMLGGPELTRKSLENAAELLALAR